MLIIKKYTFIFVINKNHKQSKPVIPNKKNIFLFFDSLSFDIIIAINNIKNDNIITDAEIDKNGLIDVNPEIDDYNDDFEEYYSDDEA